MNDTPRTDFVAHESGDTEWNRFPNRFGRMMAHAQILERENARLKAAMERHSEDEMLLNTIERSTCLWTEMDADTNNWDTSCGTAWTIVDGTPTSNEIKYCHGCGLLIKVADKPLHGTDGELIERRKCERRVKQVRQYFTENGNERSGNDRRKT